MVKHLFSYASALAVTLMMAACSNEVDNLAPNGSADSESVTLTLKVPETIQSRAVNSDVAISTGACINKLHYAIYITGTDKVVYTTEKVDGLVRPVSNRPGTGTEDSGTEGPNRETYVEHGYSYDEATKTFTINLPYVVKSQAYDLIFWACHEEDTYNVYTFDVATQTVTIDYSNIKNNEENRDAFFTSEKGVVLSNSNGKVFTLRRPFAQLNIGTNDLGGAQQAGLKNYTGIEVTVKNVYTKLNLLSGIASETTNVTFAKTEENDVAKNPWPLAEEEQEDVTWLSMNYILTGNQLLPLDENGNEIKGKNDNNTDDSSISTASEEGDNGENSGDDNTSDDTKEVYYDVNKAQKETMDVDFTLYGINAADQNWSYTYNLSGIPFQRNYRTFITGQLCTTSDDKLKILIAPDFYDQYVENLDPKEYQ